MRVYKLKYKWGKGSDRTTNKYYIDFYDHIQRRRRLPGFTDRKATENLGRMVERLACCRGSKDSLDHELTEWLEVCPARLKKTLARWGLIEPEKAAGGKPLSEHLSDWRDSILAGGGGEKQADQQKYRAKRIFDTTGFSFWTDIKPDRVQKTIYDLKKSEAWSDRTAAFYLKACKQFGAWMLTNRRAGENPLVSLRIKDKIIESEKRRAFTAAEIQALLHYVETAPERCGLAGIERRLLYLFACQTGLRVNEIKSLTVNDFDFNRNQVTVRAENAKNRTAATLPLRAETAELFKAYLADKLPQAPAFRLPWDLTELLKKDLAGAGIDPKDTGSGRLCFHSFRHTLATMLAGAGVTPRTAMDLMRHSDIRLTMQRYSHVLHDQLEDAVSALPDFSFHPGAQEARKTGTDDGLADWQNITAEDEKFTADYLHKNDGKTVKTTDVGGQIAKNENVENRPITPLKRCFSQYNELRPTGFEPVTFGSVDRRSIQLGYGRLCIYLATMSSEDSLL
jgi:integrase